MLKQRYYASLRDPHSRRGHKHFRALLPRNRRTTFCYRDPTRDVVFLWADAKEKGMIGLWGPNTAYGSQNSANRKCHIALAVRLDQLIDPIKKRSENGIDTFGFGGNKTDEP